MSTAQRPIFLNLLVFDSDFQSGSSQVDLVQKAIDLGFTHIEIRREYFRNVDTELQQIRELVNKFDLTLFYSVPDQLYIEGKLNPKLTTYLDESLFLGVTQIKWTIGDFDTELHQNELKALLKKGVKITVENDQTQESGRIATVESFMKQINTTSLPIGYVLDLGNFRFVGENEMDALDKLAPYVTYLHLKDVTYQNEQPLAIDLDSGVIDWQSVLHLLPSIPVAIEYPTSSTNAILQAKEKIQEALSYGQTN